MEINFKDYLSDERMTEIVEQEFRHAVQTLFYSNRETERILSNLSYRVAEDIVASHLNMTKEEYRDGLTARIREVLEDGDKISFEVFHRKSYVFDHSDSPVIEIMNTVLKESKPIIEKRVNEIIARYPFNELQEDIEDTIYECIMRKFHRED